MAYSPKIFYRTYVESSSLATVPKKKKNSSLARVYILPKISSSSLCFVDLSHFLFYFSGLSCLCVCSSDTDISQPCFEKLELVDAERKLSFMAAYSEERRDESGKEMLHKTKVIQFLGRTTPIILQNDNGPCPLLAICK